MLAGRKTLSSLDTGQARTYFMEKLTAKRSPRQAPAKGVLAPKGVPEPAEGVALGERSSLLYLYSNNSTEALFQNVSKLSPYHKKQAFILFENCNAFIRKVGIAQVGFLTFTFPDNVTDHKEAARRFNSLNTHFLKKFFGMWMLVKERQKRGAWHFHILIDCRCDIRTGIKWDEIHPAHGRPKYTSAPPALRSIWRILRERLPAFGFGRAELLPIKTNAQATARYVGKYVSKHIGAREDRDKGVRLVAYSQKFESKSSTKMQWATDGARAWRDNLAHFCKLCGFKEDPEEAFERLKEVFGPQWAFHLQHYISIADTLTPPEIHRIKNLYRSLSSAPSKTDRPGRPLTALVPTGEKVFDQKTGLFRNGPGRVLVHLKTGEILF